VRRSVAHARPPRRRRGQLRPSVAVVVGPPRRATTADDPERIIDEGAFGPLQREAREVVGQVDVERERGISHHTHGEADAPRFRHVKPERPGPVPELEGRIHRHAEDRRAVVAVAGDEHSDGLRTIACHRRERPGKREIRVRDHNARAAARRHPLAARTGGPVEAPGVVDRGDPALRRPGSNVAITRYHRDDELRRGLDDLTSETATERGSFRRVEFVGESRLAERERADRYHHAGSVDGHPT
jgi:hypothetical protein